MNNNHIAWIALDWGTTHFRAWALARTGEILDQVKSSKGMGGLNPDQFEPTLLNEIGKWLDGRTSPVQAFACGMIGARQGWVEAKYIFTPSQPPANQNLVKAPTTDGRIEVFIVPGMAQKTPADVMRGEETQMAGFLDNMPHFDGVICLPGTHSKWARVENGIVQNFVTFMTGELFGLLSKQSVLRHSVESDEWDTQSFLSGVKVAMQSPETVSQELFAIRPQSLLHAVPASVSKARLSGLLIGAELRATKELWTNNHLSLIGDTKLCDHYNIALEHFGCHATIAEGDMMTLAGLHAVASQVMEQAS